MLSLPIDTLEWIVQRAREFDVKDVNTSDDEATDDSDAYSVLEEHGDDTAASELRSWIADLTDRQQAELVAIFWIGRGDGEMEDLPELVAEAMRAKTTPTEDYLLGSPMLADHLEAGIEKVSAAEATD